MIRKHHRHRECGSRDDRVAQCSRRGHDGVNAGEHNGCRGNQEYRTNNRFWDSRQDISHLRAQAVQEKEDPSNLSHPAGGYTGGRHNTDIRSILTNEKYCGDVLLQKTFIQDCISKKVIPNTGQLPKYLIQNHHEGIVSRETFDAVQLEMARRNAKAGATRKSTPTGRGKYSGKHVLSNLLFCGECGTAYRRCVWTQHGMKRPVWRCVSRLDYGKKFCTQSPTLDEEPLQQAILAAVNAAMAGHDALTQQLTAAMERELAPVLGESMSLADIDRALEELSGQFNSLLAEASANPGADYTERFRELSESTARLREQKARLERTCQEQGRLQNRLRAVSAAMEHMTAALTEWDEGVIHQLLEKVTVLSREKIRVTFRDGREIEQAVNQPKRRCVTA